MKQIGEAVVQGVFDGEGVKLLGLEVIPVGKERAQY